MSCSKDNLMDWLMKKSNDAEIKGKMADVPDDAWWYSGYMTGFNVVWKYLNDMKDNNDAE